MIRKCNYNSLLPCAATNFANSKNCHLNNLKVENFIVANTSWNFKALVLPTRLRESDVFSFRRSLSRGLPDVALETLVDRNLQKSQNLSKTSSGNTLDKVGAVGSTRALKF